MQDLVIIQEKQPITTSRKVAEKFKKEHSKVLRAIRELECSKEFNESNFGLVDYTDKKGEQRPEYTMTRDGFTLVAFSFTGKEAMKFKEEYIVAFNTMEKKVRYLGLPQSLPEALKLYANELEQKQLLEEKIKADSPKLEYLNNVLSSKSTYTTTQVAKELDMTAIELNKYLKSQGIIFKQTGTWMLKRKYQGKEYAKSKTYTYKDSSGAVCSNMQMVWTEKGRKFIHSIVSIVKDG